MKAKLLSALLVLSTTTVFAADYTVRDNTVFGTPNNFKSGTVIKDNNDGSYTIRDEVSPGSGRGNIFKSGKVITPTEDGRWRVQKELTPGSGKANPFDSGYTIEKVE